MVEKSEVLASQKKTTYPLLETPVSPEVKPQNQP